MDYYTVIFLIPKTGDRIVIDGIEAEIEKKIDHPETLSLAIILKMATPTPSDQYYKMAEMLVDEKLFLYFKDVHPNLIKGYVKGIIRDQQTTTIKFNGNVTDKEYLDYVTEIETVYNQEVFNINPEPKPDPGFKKKVHFKKEKEKAIKILKRKLTF
jgi:hypothetical protein